MTAVVEMLNDDLWAQLVIAFDRILELPRDFSAVLAAGAGCRKAVSVIVYLSPKM